MPDALNAMLIWLISKRSPEEECGMPTNSLDCALDILLAVVVAWRNRIGFFLLFLLCNERLWAERVVFRYHVGIYNDDVVGLFTKIV